MRFLPAALRSQRSVQSLFRETQAEELLGNVQQVAELLSEALKLDLQSQYDDVFIQSY